MGFLDDILDNVGEPFQGSKGFGWGTHEVIIGAISSKQKKTRTNDAAEIIEVQVFDPADNEKTATCTLYFHTEGGARMSVAKVLGIMVHNVGEEKKDVVRELGKKLFAAINDPTEARNVAAKLMNEKLIGKKAYLVAEPTGKYKTTSYGDLWHYPAKPQSEPQNETQEVAKAVGGSVADESELPADLDL